mmetsp:Transcript_6407/g.12062  ORF Transcript_6407/g.12062 Transcript_6407/m.12062 type:complete len:111 (-) Transcript_6407:987-1319(-)
MSAINFPGLEYIPFKEVWDCNTYTQASTLQSNIPLGIVPKFTGSCSWQADQTVDFHFTKMDLRIFSKNVLDRKEVNFPPSQYSFFYMSSDKSVIVGCNNKGAVTLMVRTE